MTDHPRRDGVGGDDQPEASGSRRAGTDPSSQASPGFPTGVRRARLAGCCRLAAARVRGQLLGAAPGRSGAIVLAVAFTLALLLVVTGLALALTAGGPASAHDAAVEIEPEATQPFPSVDGIEERRLAGASAGADAIESRDGVAHASPVLVEPVGAVGSSAAGAGNGGEVAGSDVETRRILAVGVEPADVDGSVAGLPIRSLGSGAAPAESGIVLSEPAADRLDVDAGEAIYVRRGSQLVSLPVTAVEPGSSDGTASNRGAPVALVPLETLQRYSGAAEADLADRVLVWGDEAAALAASETAYPDASVAATGAHPTALFDGGLALATSAIALLVGVVVCGLFVATTAGIAVAEDRRNLAILLAVGFSRRSCLTIVAVATLVTVLCGALVGVGLGLGGIAALEWLTTAFVGRDGVVAAHPLFVPYAVAVATVAGALAIPYPLAIAARTDVLAEVTG
ncbi:FtsX-like permease family protein [Halovivax limisalsi]|uniref:FtsX-like permease family protein n=1 Tax=Halovivax limisalsi TaxID=1453760 RepID=UPI001FFDD8D0|nr:FtsX-like permease family protein [Halovivax limisalsi]